jgi:hypothetical protein
VAEVEFVGDGQFVLDAGVLVLGYDVDGGGVEAFPLTGDDAAPGLGQLLTGSGFDEGVTVDGDAVLGVILHDGRGGVADGEAAFVACRPGR